MTQQPYAWKTEDVKEMAAFYRRYEDMTQQKQTTKHTPTPWAAEPVERQMPRIVGADFHYVAQLCWNGLNEKSRGTENAQRIVAAVNATSMLSTADLEAGVVQELIDALRDLTPDHPFTEHTSDPSGGPCPTCLQFNKAHNVLARIDEGGK